MVTWFRQMTTHESGTKFAITLVLIDVSRETFIAIEIMMFPGKHCCSKGPCFEKQFCK